MNVVFLLKGSNEKSHIKIWLKSGDHGHVNVMLQAGDENEKQFDAPVPVKVGFECLEKDVTVRLLLRDDDDDFQITRKVKLEFGYVKHVVVKLNSYHESIGDNFSGLKKS